MGGHPFECRPALEAFFALARLAPLSSHEEIESDLICGLISVRKTHNTSLYTNTPPSSIFVLWALWKFGIAHVHTTRAPHTRLPLPKLMQPSFEESRIFNFTTSFAKARVDDRYIMLIKQRYTHAERFKPSRVPSKRSKTPSIFTEVRSPSLRETQGPESKEALSRKELLQVKTTPYPRISGFA